MATTAQTHGIEDRNPTLRSVVPGICLTMLGVGVDGQLHGEVNAAEQQDLRVQEHLPAVGLSLAGLGVLGVLGLDRRCQCGLLPAGEPRGVLDPGVQEEEHREADGDGQQSFQACRCSCA
ncbi:hypothetical protein [Arthrobacter sp. UYEF20]|uniref:hypothetical protein n=1 Tax=Arthrobacter sp. UYEF20 TaxID=1756363 RepID=UPI003399F3D4